VVSANFYRDHPKNHEATANSKGIDFFADPDILAYLKRNSLKGLDTGLLDDDAVTLTKPKKKLLLKYNGRPKTVWNLIIAITAYLNGFIIPFHIAFEY